MAADWSRLPMDPLFAIAMKLEHIEDFIYFSVVCRWWSVISSEIKHQWRGTQVPWLLLAENKLENPNCLRKIFNLRNKKCYHLKLPETFGTRCWGGAYGWVVKFERDLNVQLFNPITKAQISFPSSATIPNKCSNFDIKNEKDIIWFLISFEKVVVLKMCRGDNHEFVIVVLSMVGVAFARHGDQSWTVLSSHERCSDTQIVDIVGVDNNLFALYNDGTIVYWNFKEIVGSEVVKPVVFASTNCQISEMLYNFRRELSVKYLVHYDGDFLMVVRRKDELDPPDFRNYGTRAFKVFGLHPKKREWVELTHFGGVAVFVGGNSSMSISVTLAKHLKRSCIYFTDDEYQYLQLPVECGGHDMGIYNMKRKSIWQFYKGVDMRSSYCPPTWFIPQL